MRNYIVSYITTDNKYVIEFTTSNDILQALKKTIPKFSELIKQLYVESSTVTYRELLLNSNRINIETFNISEAPILTNNIKSQVINIYNPFTKRLSTIYYNCSSKLDAVYRLMTSYLKYEDETMMDAYNNKDMQTLILYFATQSGLRIYTVSTLKQLVKQSINQYQKSS